MRVYNVQCPEWSQGRALRVVIGWDWARKLAKPPGNPHPRKKKTTPVERQHFPNKYLHQTFPRAKLWRQFFMTRAEVWAKNWAKNSARFRASFAVQNDPHIFSRNSSQFITSCLGAEIL